MTDTAAPAGGKTKHQTLSGSCHCGAIKLLAKDVNLSESAGKCNCSYCMITDNLYMRVDDGNLIIYPSITANEAVDTDTGYAAGHDAAHTSGYAINHSNISALLSSKSLPEELKMYRFNKHVASHLFCGSCATHIACVGDYGEKFATVNLRALDLEKVGSDITDLTHPSKIKYVDGKNAFDMRVGEPFPGGCW